MAAAVYLVDLQPVQLVLTDYFLGLLLVVVLFQYLQDVLVVDMYCFDYSDLHLNYGLFVESLVVNSFVC